MGGVGACLETGLLLAGETHPGAPGTGGGPRPNGGLLVVGCGLGRGSRSPACPWPSWLLTGCVLCSVGCVSLCPPGWAGPGSGGRSLGLGTPPPTLGLPEGEDSRMKLAFQVWPS